MFLLFIFYHYYKIEEEHIRSNIFLEMKNYSLSFEDERFDIDIIPYDKEALYELNEDNETLFILVPFQDSKEDLLKIVYAKKGYMNLLDELQKKLFFQFLMLSIIAIILSILAALYTLQPLRNALGLLEDFIKDIIHDLNTPLTSILINLKMMKGESKEIESISRSAKNIVMLHQNLDCYLKEVTNTREKFYLKEIIDNQVKFFVPLYDYLEWKVDVSDLVLYTDKNALSRIIYNLLSNACKHNTSMGNISMELKHTTLILNNDSYGIKEPNKVFERFYKESERGLGIGLHIVEKLCDELQIYKSLVVDKKRVTVSLNLSEVTYQ